MSGPNLVDLSDYLLQQSFLQKGTSACIRGVQTSVHSAAGILQAVRSNNTYRTLQDERWYAGISSGQSATIPEAIDHYQKHGNLHMPKTIPTGRDWKGSRAEVDQPLLRLVLTAEFLFDGNFEELDLLTDPRRVDRITGELSRWHARENNMPVREVNLTNRVQAADIANKYLSRFSLEGLRMGLRFSGYAV